VPASVFRFDGLIVRVIVEVVVVQEVSDGNYSNPVPIVGTLV